MPIGQLVKTDKSLNPVSWIITFSAVTGALSTSSKVLLGKEKSLAQVSVRAGFTADIM